MISYVNPIYNEIESHEVPLFGFLFIFLEIMLINTLKSTLDKYNMYPNDVNVFLGLNSHSW